jgi:hypothetical protein
MLVFIHKCISRIDPGVFVGYLGLFRARACVGEKLDAVLFYLFYMH